MTPIGMMIKLLEPAVLATSLRWGRMTARARMLPSFLIAGAQRCGTTSMYRALVQHAAILRPPLRKGVHYFDTGYDHGVDWYRAHFPLRSTGRRGTRRTGAPAQTFESSPYYLFHPLAGARIAEVLPGVRIIVLLRDPVERAYSAYTHEAARGFESESFERALELEPERLAGEEELVRAGRYSFAHQHHAYLARGRYAEQLDALANHVERANIHVVDSQDFFDDPAPVYEQVLKFLELPVLGTPVYDQHNARPRAPMGGALRRRLTEYFEPYDERLEAWLGAVPSWRR